MRIHIDSLEISCIIGLLDFERDFPQRVCLDMTIDYAYREKAFLDYAKVVELVEADLQATKYLLLEDALSGLKKKLFEIFPGIEKLKIKITKPDILPHCTVGISETWINTPL